MLQQYPFNQLQQAHPALSPNEKLPTFRVLANHQVMVEACNRWACREFRFQLRQLMETHCPLSDKDTRGCWHSVHHDVQGGVMLLRCTPR